MTLHWTKEDTPRWDTEKQRLFGPAELAAVGLQAPEPGAAIADEWWRVTDDAGSTVGYGWLDTEWGDAQITFLVAPSRRQAGIGEYIVGRLEAEAADRGVNYIYNVVPDSHPDPGWMKRWLAKRGFVPGIGDLRRQVAHEDALAPRDGLRPRGRAASHRAQPGPRSRWQRWARTQTCPGRPPARGRHFQARRLGGGGVVAAAFGDVQVADGTHMRERDSQRGGSSDCP